MLNIIPRFTGNLPDDLPVDLQPLYQRAPTLARLLAARGVKSDEELEYTPTRLLSADGLRDIDIAVDLLDAAIDDKERILIVGDFDCDGATSTALMVRILGEMGADVQFVVPDRFKYGYGLTPEIVQLGIDDYQPDMIVTVDNGISSHAGVDKARAHGLKVIITDHHLTTKPTPHADAVVNPNQLDCHFDSKSLVGVGVAFYVLGRLAKQRRMAGKSTAQVSKHLDLVALGTIADVGVLDHNNRILVHLGIKAIREKRCSLGILALLEQAGRDYKKVGVQDFGFALGPRINAAGRMDNMRIGIECLLADDWDTAQKLAHQLDELNKQRRHVEGEMRAQADAIVDSLQVLPSIEQANLDPVNLDAIRLDLANSDAIRLDLANSDAISPDAVSLDRENDVVTEDTEQADSVKEAVNDVSAAAKLPMQENEAPRSIVLYQDDWHQGVIGIVAGRLKEHHYRPAIVFAPADSNKVGPTDAIKGSARSIPGIHIRDAIEQIAESNPELITHFGGHAMAAGLTLQKKHFTQFAEAFETLMRGLDDDLFEEASYTDGQLQPADISLQFADSLINANIWGQGFLPPQFDGVFTVLSHRILKDKHLKLSLQMEGVQYPIDAIWFNFDADSWSYRAKQVHILFELDINEWNGSQNIQFMIKDLAVVEES